MHWFDFSFELPEENLALDELLLEDAESGAGGEVLRFWESPVRFVVLGVGQKYRDEVCVEACDEDGVPVRRRCSAGGCVLQGPGSLNYTLVLDTQSRPELRALHDSYDVILGRLAEELRLRGIPAERAGISDIAVSGRKISGNAQRRKKRHILHHGTLLYGLDVSTLGRYLREPADRPDYRGEREHESFVTNLPIARAALASMVRETFHTVDEMPLVMSLVDRARVLAREKYARDDWTYRR